jgi:hypothetical protein
MVAEPEGRADECGPAETSALQEGAAQYPRSHVGSAPLGLGVQALRGQPHPASDLESLDMFAGMNEPELLMALLLQLSIDWIKRGGRANEWAIVARYAKDCVEALEKANETPPRR